MNYRMFLGGLKSYLPISRRTYTGTGGTSSGSYCYSIWLRHLVLIDRASPGFRAGTVVEIGPGDSVGLGLAALLGGAKRYVGLDVLPHASRETNLRVLSELVALYRARTPIPGPEVFPDACPALPSYGYPQGLVDDGKLEANLAPANIARLEDAVGRIGEAGSLIRYLCPWDSSSVRSGEADLVVSQGALQDMDHFPNRDNLRHNLEAMRDWLRPGGIMSHHIELGCPGGAPWNHHWAYGDIAWRLIRGNRPYYKNRVPLSEYLRLLKEIGLEVISVEPTRAQGLPRERLASQFRDLPVDDYQTRAALVIAVRR